MVNRAVFFDRDGILNHLIKRSDGRNTSPWLLSELKLTTDAKSAVKIASNKGYIPLCVSNQPGCIDGDMSIEELARVNETIRLETGIIEICCALDRESEDYKPEAGLIFKLIKKYDIDASSSFMVGDRWKDIEAGLKANLITVLLETELEPYPSDRIRPHYRISSLLDLTHII
jgi:D-glycero-D-manno-heptose 1,7-bisphosphate phosphatase